MKNIPRPSEMTPEEFNDVLEKAMKKIENGKPLTIADMPLKAFDTDEPRDDFREGEVIWHVLNNIREGRNGGYGFVSKGAPEDPMLIVARVENAVREYGSYNQAYEAIAKGTYTKIPRAKKPSQKVTAKTIKDDFLSARKKLGLSAAKQPRSRSRQLLQPPGNDPTGG